MEFKCKQCGVKLKFSNAGIEYTDIKGKRLVGCCKNCGKELEDKLKEEYFIEEYKGNNIYRQDGKYVPYWGCRYYFKSLEDCRVRMDNSNCAVVNVGDFHTLNSMINE